MTVKSEESQEAEVVGQSPVIETMDFPTAITKVMAGQRVTRQEWNNSNIVGLLRNSRLMIFINGDYHVWEVSDGDMMSVDWVVALQN